MPLKFGKISDDTCRCVSYNCPYKEQCLRYTHKSNSECTPYSALWEINKQGKCDFFIKE